MSASTGRDHVPWEWIGVALLSHTAWGGYPVLARFLQNQADLPTPSLGALIISVTITAYSNLQSARAAPKGK